MLSSSSGTMTCEQLYRLHLFPSCELTSYEIVKSFLIISLTKFCWTQTLGPSFSFVFLMHGELVVDDFKTISRYLLCSKLCSRLQRHKTHKVPALKAAIFWPGTTVGKKGGNSRWGEPHLWNYYSALEFLELLHFLFYIILWSSS